MADKLTQEQLQSLAAFCTGLIARPPNTKEHIELFTPLSAYKIGYEDGWNAYKIKIKSILFPKDG